MSVEVSVDVGEMLLGCSSERRQSLLSEHGKGSPSIRVVDLAFDQTGLHHLVDPAR
jgi:hypothetical protein